MLLRFRFKSAQAESGCKRISHRKRPARLSPAGPLHPFYSEHDTGIRPEYDGRGIARRLVESKTQLHRSKAVTLRRFAARTVGLTC
jgi:hypothetical protein